MYLELIDDRLLRLGDIRVDCTKVSLGTRARPIAELTLDLFRIPVEYAMEAIKLGSTTVGITTPHGTILAVEKRVQSTLLETSSIEKIMEIDSHIGCAMSGLTADARTMVEHARMTGQMHAFTYDEPIKVESVAQAVCDLALRFGESVDDDEAMMVSVLCGRSQTS
jgi:20S proteasome alpha/beta subunit